MTHSQLRAFCLQMMVKDHSTWLSLPYEYDMQNLFWPYFPLITDETYIDFNAQDPEITNKSWQQTINTLMDTKFRNKFLEISNHNHHFWYWAVGLELRRVKLGTMNIIISVLLGSLTIVLVNKMPIDSFIQNYPWCFANIRKQWLQHGRQKFRTMVSVFCSFFNKLVVSWDTTGL